MNALQKETLMQEAALLREKIVALGIVCGNEFRISQHRQRLADIEAELAEGARS